MFVYIGVVAGAGVKGAGGGGFISDGAYDTGMGGYAKGACCACAKKGMWQGCMKVSTILCPFKNVCRAGIITMVSPIFMGVVIMEELCDATFGAMAC